MKTRYMLYRIVSRLDYGVNKSITILESDFPEEIVGQIRQEDPTTGEMMVIDYRFGYNKFLPPTSFSKVYTVQEFLAKFFR